VAWVAWDVAKVAQLPMAQMFHSHMPTIEQRSTDFHTEAHVTGQYQYDGVSYGQATLPSEMANVGQVECMIFPGLNIWAPKDEHGHVIGLGAKGRGDPAYRGEAYTASGKGKAELAVFTPNKMTVHVDDGVPGDLVVLNQNWDPGWRADGGPVVDYRDAVATRIDRPNQTFVFRYRPSYWWLSLAIFALTATGIVFAFVRRRCGRLARLVRLRVF
jgi:hypothetical protein